MPLSDLRIRNLKPADKPYKRSDFDGLFILVNPRGSKLWRFKYRFRDREKLISFGPYPSVSLLQARKLRDSAREQLAAGIDPSEHRQEEKAVLRLNSENSFENVAKGYVNKIKREGRAEVTLTKVIWYLSMAIADFGQKPISEVSSPVVLKSLKKVENKGHYETARRLRSTVGAVFRFAIANGLAEIDPTFPLRDALIRPSVKSRAAITDKTVLGGLMRSIENYRGQPTTRIAMGLLAILATRPGELRNAEWTEFDIKAKIWAIPAERMKMRLPHTVPLPERALDLLRELKELTGWGSLLFPSNTSSKRPISENTLNAALRRMGYSSEEMTSHGFRATFSTIANESGLWHPDAIERALAHVERNEVRRAYARGAHWDERVKMARWWAGLLEELRSQ
jgi:integrase